MKKTALTTLLATAMLCACNKPVDEEFYTCRMGDNVETVMKKLDKEGIRYHETAKDGSVSIFLDNVNDYRGVHFDNVQMFFDANKGKRLGMVIYCSLRSIDSQTDFDVMTESLKADYHGDITRDTTNILQMKHGSMYIDAERIDPEAYSGVYLTYTDTLYCPKK